MTVLSRVLGFLRDMIFARLLGADAATDAFFLVFKIPNLLRRLFVEGAFSQAIVPIITEYQERNQRNELTEFLNRVSGSLILGLLVVTVLGIMTAPQIIMLLAPGFDVQSEQFQLAVELLKIILPYLFFISLVAFASGILNSFDHFAIPAFTPVILNVCLIITAIWIAPNSLQPVKMLAWAVLVAGILQLWLQIPVLNRLNLLPKPKIIFKDAAVSRMMSLMLPSVFGVSVTQLNLFTDTLMASFLTTGSVSWLYYSDRLVEFPLGVFGVAVSTAILPILSKKYAARQMAHFSDALNWGLRLVLFISIPASIGLVVLAEPIIITLFQNEAFNHYDVSMAAVSLMAYAFGLLGFVLIKLLVPAFTSRLDMKTPVRWGIYALVTNILLNLVFIGGWGHMGLALATSLAAFVNAGLLLFSLIKQSIFQPQKKWLSFVIRLLFASAIMLIILIYGLGQLTWYDMSSFRQAGNLFMLIMAGIISYGGALWLSGFRFRQLTSATGL